MRTIFVFAYYSFKDPIFQSAVLPYLKILNSNRIRIVLLTWEQKQYLLPSNERHLIKCELKENNILWKSTKWRSGNFKILKKAFDFVKGLSLSLLLIIKYNVHTIFSEGFPGAIFGHYLSIVTGKKHIVHTFEPHADYMKDAAVWSDKSWEYKFLKKLEIPIALRAKYIITATEEYKKKLQNRGIGNNIIVIPSCIDTSFYKFLPEARKAIRSKLNISHHTIAIVYLGKLGGMYMEEEVFAFFKHALNFVSVKVYFYLFTNESQKKVNKLLTDYKIPSDKVFFKFLQKGEVPMYLSAADVAFCGVRPIESQRYSSPIKNGEYWACGLPILMPIGVSDDYIHNEKFKLGFNFSHYSQITEEILLNMSKLDRKYIRHRGIELRSLAKNKDKLINLFL